MMAVEEKKKSDVRNVLNFLFRIAAPVGLLVSMTLTRIVSADSGFVVLGILQQLNSIGTLLTEIATILSVALFVLAGIFYAIGQIMPPDKKAAFHTTSVNIIIGAIVLAALSVASTGLANSSGHLLINATSNTITNTLN